MSKFEQLRLELVRIHQEASQREVAKGTMQQVEVKEEERKRKEEETTQKLAEYNWPLVKTEILGILNEINANVLSGHTAIVGWKTRTVEHEHVHSEYVGVGIDPYDSEYVDVTCLYHETVEVAELLIPTAGSISLFRTTGGYHNKQYCDGYHRSRREPINSPSKDVKILFRTPTFRKI